MNIDCSSPSRRLASQSPLFEAISADFVSTVFRQKVRFFGAGTIGVAAIWTLLKVIGPIVRGIAAALSANRARNASGQGMDSLALTERDLPVGIVFGTILALMVPIAALLWWFAGNGPIAQSMGLTVMVSVLYVLVAGIMIASVTGYMAGLIGDRKSVV